MLLLFFIDFFYFTFDCLLIDHNGRKFLTLFSRRVNNYEMFLKVQEVRPNTIIFCVIFCQIMSAKKHRNTEQIEVEMNWITFGTLCKVQLIGQDMQLFSCTKPVSGN